MHLYSRLTTSVLVLLAVACGDAATTVEPAPLTPVTLTIVDPGVVRDGDVLTLRAEARTADNRVVPNVPVQWVSVNPSVATTTPTGLVTALREGTTEVVATTGTLQARRTLAVLLHPAVSLELTKPVQTLPLGTRGGVTALLRGLDGRQLLNRPITLTSSNEAVARVNASMEIIPVSPGTAVITARYGTLSATVQVRVPAPVGFTTYDVRTLGGVALPIELSKELERENGMERVFNITRLENGTVSLGDRYEVSLSVVHYQRVELNGAISERVLSRQTIRDQGQLWYNWITHTGILQSSVVGGLTHTLDTNASGVQLNFREGGTTTVWALGLGLR